jgi:hypothetical protein
VIEAEFLLELLMRLLTLALIVAASVLRFASGGKFDT